MSATVDKVIAILVRQGYADLAEKIAVLEASERASRLEVATGATQLSVTAQDRDNRRRRMDLAMIILDESQPVNLEAIAAIVWPEGNPAEGSLGIAEHLQRKMEFNSLYGKFATGTPAPGDPTQQPSQPFPGYDCVTMGHRWENISDQSGKWHRCTVCNDVRAGVAPYGTPSE